MGASYIAHGSTGAGNDQVRFDMIFQVLAPEIEIITPIRDKKLARQEEIDYLQAQGIHLEWQKPNTPLIRDFGEPVLVVKKL